MTPLDSLPEEWRGRAENRVALAFARRRRANRDTRTPYQCTGPSFVHTVTDDNPRPTGRCLSCRRFVVKTRTGWRTATMAQALNWGLVGAGVRRSWAVRRGSKR